MTDVVLMHPYSWPHVRQGGERYLHDLGWPLRRLPQVIFASVAHG